MNTRRPRRWIIELLLVVMLIVLLLGESALPLSPGWDRVASLLIAGLTLGLAGLWIHVNRGALMAWEIEAAREDERQRPARRID